MSSTARRGWATVPGGSGGTTHRWRKLRPLVLARDGHTCQINGARCTGTATTVDHITALADGGAMYDPANLRAACLTCNASRAGGTRYAHRPATTTVERRTRW